MSQERDDNRRPASGTAADGTADDRALMRAVAIARRQEAIPTAQSRALVDRVVAAAVAERASVLAEGAGDARVVPLRRAAPTVVVPQPVRRRAAFEVAALLAASLLAGIYVGGLSPSLTAVQDVASAMGFETASADVFQALGSDEPGSETLEDSL